MALSAVLVQRTAYSALPPVSVGSSSQSESSPASVAPGATAPGETAEEETAWWRKVGIIAPRYTWYGSVGYEWLKNSAEDKDVTSQGLNTILGARFNSYVWQPWFGRFFGDMRMHLGQNSVDGGSMPGASGGSKNLMMTGNARLSLLYRSPFPFEAYYDRTYNRTMADYSPVMGSTLSQRFGFTQSYAHKSGANGSLDWNRSTQTANNSFGGTSTDSLLLTLAHRLPEHTMAATIGHSSTRQDGIDSRASQNNISISHNYAPEDDYYTIDNTANVNTSGYRFDGATSDARLAQLNTVATYRPEEEPYTITGTFRVLRLATELANMDVAGTANKRTLETANLSLGMTYTLSRDTYAYGAVSLNSSDSNGQRTSGNSQSVSITHSPEGTRFGEYHYRWSGSAGASRSGESGGSASGVNHNSAQLSLQLSHTLSRNLELESGSRINFAATQAISAAVQSRRRNFQDRPDALATSTPGTKRLTHNASIAWSSANEGTTSGMVHLSASDSRTLDGNAETFQMVNLQFSGSLQTGADSAWSGNIAVQAIKQDIGGMQNIVPSTQQNGDINVTSNGSLSYRHSRLFGIRRLSFNTSVRMSSSALLPMLGGATDYETAAWDTRIDYAIGRLTVRAHALISRDVTPMIRRTADGFELTEGEPRINKSIMFTVTRSFGY